MVSLKTIDSTTITAILSIKMLFLLYLLKHFTKVFLFLFILSSFQHHFWQYCLFIRYTYENWL